MPSAGTESEDKPSWADQMEEGEDDVTTIPPSEERLGNGIKVLTDYKRTEEGKLVKMIRTYRIETRKVSKVIAKRKAWKKFGDAVNDLPDAPDPSTTIIAEDVFLTLTTSKEEIDKPEEDPLKKLQGAKIVSCRICKGEHWTTKCPYKDTLEPLQQQLKEEEAKQAGTGAVDAGGLKASATGKYISPGMREGAARRAGAGDGLRMPRDELATIRVTNLSEETRESDLQALFRPFGPISRIFLAKDKMTSQSKGFAFINFVHREDASRAIDGLSGFGYDHLILNVEWAKPSTTTPQ